MSDGTTEYKRTVMLGVPCYGGLTQGSAMGACFSSGRKADTKVLVRMVSHSLLAHGFNQLWCLALNEAVEKGLTHFAMIHADIEPPPGWLDAMIDELEAKRLDVLSAAVPLKDPRGLTSTALVSGDGDPWQVHCRLSLAEVHRLPETFTPADVGGRKLLLNTGLWVCRFDLKWAELVHFTINDRIVRGADGKYAAEVDSEDWDMSRKLNALGLKLGCTRKIPVDHRGQFVFSNAAPWGAWAFDHMRLDESAVPAEGNP